MNRHLILLYGGLAYIIGLGGLVLFILFIGSWLPAPWNVDAGSPGRVDAAIAINVLLIAIFGLQHSVMARQPFKRAWTRFIPPAAERSTYVLVSGVMMLLICLFWRPLVGTLWHIENPIASGAIIGLQLLGWALAVAATFVINHFELLGLEQVYCYWADKPAPPPSFSERWMYRYVRHPLQSGLLLGMWSTPTMTTTHLMLAATMTAYILIGLHLEEKDLVATLGDDYDDYRRRVPMLLPLRWRKRLRPKVVP